jgi:ABC-2 type transport system permease protein
MRKVLVIAAREYMAAVRTKTFIISLLAMPILMGGSILVQVLLLDRARHYAVLDRTGGSLYQQVEHTVNNYNKNSRHDPETGDEVRTEVLLEKIEPSADTPEAIAEQRLALSDRVRRGELTGFLEIGPQALTADEKEDAVRLQTNQGRVDDFGRVASLALTEAAQKRRLKRLQAVLPESFRDQITTEKIQEIVRPVMVTPKGLSQRDPATGKIEEFSGKERVAPFIVPFGLLMLMFMVIVMGATPMMQGVVEEKAQRIAEVLLGSVTPFRLMLGKLVGNVGVALTISAVYLGGAWWGATRYGFSRFLPVDLLLWFVLFQALAALMYGSLFIAIGAACTEIKETQNLLWPVMIIACAPLFVLTKVLQEPNGPVAIGMSFFPFATPMLMLARQAIPPGVPIWQPIVGVLGVLATTLFSVWVAGRIFRVGILMQGKGANLAEMFRWVIRG